MVLPTAIRAAAARSPIQGYNTFSSRYATAPNVAGVSPKQGMKYGLMAGYFGAATGIFAVFFFGEVPRVRKDILMSVPIVGGLFDKPEIPEQDNPF